MVLSCCRVVLSLTAMNSNDAACGHALEGTTKALLKALGATQDKISWAAQAIDLINVSYVYTANKHECTYFVLENEVFLCKFFNADKLLCSILIHSWVAVR